MASSEGKAHFAMFRAVACWAAGGDAEGGGAGRGDEQFAGVGETEG